MRWLLVVAIASCAPTVDGPLEQQRARDAADAAQLEVQLAALPGVVAAHVTLHRPADDPFTVPVPAGGSVLLVVDDAADQARVRAAAAQLADLPTVLEVGAHRAELAAVGPFTVEAGSKRQLQLALAALLAALAAGSAYAARRLAR